MGEKLALLLVKSPLFWLFISLFLPFYGYTQLVDASHYQQFWLWAAVKPQPVLANAERVYLLQGQVSLSHQQPLFLRQGQPVSTLIFPDIWLAYRVHTLAWSPIIVQQIIAQHQAWSAINTQVSGIQIDFDARSLKLADYAAFLRQLRQQLPDNCQLSITGLLDWSKTGDISVINQLAGVVDEIVVQTYQGTTTVKNYQEYLNSLLQLTIPFKVGLVQHGFWDSNWEKRLASSPFYRGEIIFLVNGNP